VTGRPPRRMLAEPVAKETTSQERTRDGSFNVIGESTSPPDARPKGRAYDSYDYDSYDSAWSRRRRDCLKRRIGILVARPTML